MNTLNNVYDRQKMVDKYFSDPDKKIMLNKNDILLQQNETNNKMFYVAAGKLVAFLPDRHLSEPVFEVLPGSFIGVYSYFSEQHRSYSQVRAATPAIVYYFDSPPEALMTPALEELRSFLFNIVVLELRSRQDFAARMAYEWHQATNKLIQTEKLVTLGQLSAGLAHELNNTIGSLSSNLGQLESEIERLLLQDKSPKMAGFFRKGRGEGQQLSSSEARHARSLWPDKLELKHATVKKLARAGIAPREVNSKQEAEEAATLWSLGNMLNAMNIAVHQATHVTNSIKSMGIANQNWSKKVMVNQTVREAIALLNNLTKQITLEVNLTEPQEPIAGCHGELVQVWTNLIKNAIESLMQNETQKPTVKVGSHETDRNIVVTVEDNGPGIPPNIADKIYEPNFTTKVKGLSLGLGLGLTIVQRIAGEHDGKITLDSRPGKTIFEITLNKPPQKNNHE